MRRFLFFVMIVLLPSIACAQRLAHPTDPLPSILPPTLPITPPPALVVANIIDTIRVRQYTPPEIYAKWWKEIMACTGLYISKATQSRIRFVYVNADAFTINNNPAPPMVYLGYSFVRDNQLMIIWDGVIKESLVKHEMTHFLMYHNAIPAGHPDKYFAKCHLND